MGILDGKLEAIVEGVIVNVEGDSDRRINGLDESIFVGVGVGTIEGYKVGFELKKAEDLRTGGEGGPVGLNCGKYLAATKNTSVNVKPAAPAIMIPCTHGGRPIIHLGQQR